MQVHFKFPSRAVRAKVVDKALVMALRDAVPPAVLRFELERLHAVSFQARETEEGYQFGLTGPKGEFSPAAKMVDAEAAQKAVKAAMRALLQNTQGLGAVLFRRLATLAMVLFGIWAVAGLILAIIFSPPQGLDSIKTAGVQGMPSDTAAMMQQIEAMQRMQGAAGGGGAGGVGMGSDVRGQPLPADQVLQPPLE